MKRSLTKTTRVILLLLLSGVILSGVACKTNKGSREFIPGRGWVPTR